MMLFIYIIIRKFFLTTSKLMLYKIREMSFDCTFQQFPSEPKAFLWSYLELSLLLEAKRIMVE